MPPDRRKVYGIEQPLPGLCLHVMAHIRRRAAPDVIGAKDQTYHDATTAAARYRQTTTPARRHWPVRPRRRPPATGFPLLKAAVCRMASATLDDLR